MVRNLLERIFHLLFLFSSISSYSSSFHGSAESSVGTTIAYEAKGRRLETPAMQDFLKSDLSDFSAPIRKFLECQVLQEMEYNLELPCT